jgi:hypothetical protein
VNQIIRYVAYIILVFENGFLELKKFSKPRVRLIFIDPTTGEEPVL